MKLKTKIFILFSILLTAWGILNSKGFASQSDFEQAFYLQFFPIKEKNSDAQVKKLYSNLEKQCEFIISEAKENETLKGNETTFSCDISEYKDNFFLWVEAVSNDGRTLFVQSEIVSKTTFATKSGKDFLDESLLDYVSSELKFQTKESGTLGDLAYSVEFAKATDLKKYDELHLSVGESDIKIALKIREDSNDYAIAKIDKSYLIGEENQTKPGIMRYYVDRNRPMVAITYDDGPYGKNTEKIIELFDEVDGRGTFYVVGTMVEKYPKTILDLIENGHEIGSHTYSHSYLTNKKTDVDFELNKVQEMILELTGWYEVKTLRPPYGSYNKSVLEAATTPFVLWSVDTLDWKTRDAAETNRAVLEGVKDGDIVLMHDIHEATVEAAETLLRALVDAGYQLVTVSEMMYYNDIWMEPGNAYSTANIH